MFTGIIQAIGKVEHSESRGGDIRLTIACGDLDLSHTGLGDSIAVNGVCLTAIELHEQSFSADVSVETMSKTSLGQLAVGSPVNLETALTLNTALGGHLVSGHVDGLGTLVEMQSDARSTRYSFEVDPEIQHYIAAKGSVTIDGTSLTVNGIEGKPLMSILCRIPSRKLFFSTIKQVPGLTSRSISSHVIWKGYCRGEPMPVKLKTSRCSKP